MLCELSAHALLPADHPLAEQGEVSLRQLCNYPLVLTNRLQLTAFLELFHFHGLQPQRLSKAYSLELQRGLVANGFGVAVAYTRPFGDHSYDGQPLAIRPIAEPLPPQRIVLAEPRASSDSPRSMRCGNGRCGGLVKARVRLAPLVRLATWTAKRKGPDNRPFFVTLRLRKPETALSFSRVPPAGFHPRLLRFVQPHAQLGAAPDGVVQLYDPLFVGQVAQFGFIQTVAEIFAQIAEAVGTGRDQLALAAVGAGIAAREASGSQPCARRSLAA